MAKTRDERRESTLNHINKWIKENHLVDKYKCPITAVQDLYDPNLIIIKTDDGKEPAPYNNLVFLKLKFTKTNRLLIWNPIYEETLFTLNEALEDLLNHHVKFTTI